MVAVWLGFILTGLACILISSDAAATEGTTQ
jgi:hypothetical protein